MSGLERAAFSWDDPFLLESQLSDEERMVMTTARDYASDRLAPRIRDAFRDESFDPAIMREMGALGFLGMTLPEPFGTALSYTCYGLVAREIERIDSAFRSALSVQSSLVMYPIFAFGSDAQKQKYLPGLASGALIGCFGLTEPDHGSDPASMTTRAVKDGASYRLSGAKMWITNAPIADLALVWAKWNAAPKVFPPRASMENSRCAPALPAKSCWRM